MIPFVPWSRAAASPALAAEGDAALAARIARGDGLALDALYRREAGAVYRYALALAGNAAWAADATQDAFLAFADRAHGFDAARGTLGAYLAGIARHALMAQARRAGADLALDDAAAPAAGPETDAAVAPEALLVRRQDDGALWAAIRALPWPFREALVLVDLQERSYQEAAAIAGIELNTLRTRLHRARSRLARALDDGSPA